MARVLLFVLLFVLLLTVPALAAPGSVPEAIAECNAVFRWNLPSLSPDQLAKLDDHKVVKVRERSDDPEMPQRVVGFLKSDVPRDHLWLAALLPDFGSLDEFYDVRMNPGVYPPRWYEMLTLPWPLKPRHWAIETGETVAAPGKSGDRCWEHYWDLIPFSAEELQSMGREYEADPDKLGQAIVPPVNHGAWIAIALPDGGTLLAYHVTAVIGGNVPDKLVTSYAMSTLRKVLFDVEKRATEAVSIYSPARASSKPLMGGDGTPMPAPK
jgi:hypothetical protein